jgi:hypothetical protein
MTQNLRLRKFDPSKMGDNRVAIFIGKRGTGKTTLVTDILYHKRHIPAGVVMSGTEEGNGHYGTIVPDSYIYPDFDKDVVEKIISRQRRIARNKSDGDSRVFMLMDDCLYDRKITREKCIRSLFFNGRHWSIFLLITMQYCMDMGPDLRSNCDYVFVCRENIRTVRERIYKSFFGIFPTFDMFCQVMDACTTDYQCLVLDNTSTSNSVEDCVFWYKADMHPSFRVGCDRFWKYHAQTYKPHDTEDSPETEYHPAGRNSHRIRVHKLQ